MEENQQELIFKFQMFEQQARQLQEQMQAVEQGIAELESLSLGLDELKGKTGEEIMAPVGRGIFAKAKLISEELTVDVGDKILVKKSIEDTQKLIGEQIKKLENVKIELDEHMHHLQKDLESTMNQAQESASKEAE